MGELSFASLSEIENKIEMRLKIHQFQNEVAKLEQVEIPTTHTFSKDVYAREIKIPAGTVLVGKIHKHENLNIISKGKITVVSVEGIKTIEAPYTFVSTPGVKRVGFAHEDTVWTTIHGTSETDLEKIEEQFIAKDYSGVEGISTEELSLLQEVLNGMDGSSSGIGCRIGNVSSKEG